MLHRSEVINMKKAKKIIIETLDTISVSGFVITAVIVIKYNSSPVWVSIGFAALGIIVNTYEMLNKKQYEENLNNEF